MDTRPIRTTIDSLAALARPARGTRPGNGRLAPTERQLFCIDGRILAYDEEADGDLHVVLGSLIDPRIRMIVEIPDARCRSVCGLPLAPLAVAARTAVFSALQGGGEDIRVRVTGVAFFDHSHRQIGAAPNFVELHPVLRVVPLPAAP